LKCTTWSFFLSVYVLLVWRPFQNSLRSLHGPRFFFLTILSALYPLPSLPPFFDLSPPGGGSLFSPLRSQASALFRIPSSFQIFIAKPKHSPLFAFPPPRTSSGFRLASELSCVSLVSPFCDFLFPRVSKLSLLDCPPPIYVAWLACSASPFLFLQSRVWDSPQSALHPPHLLFTFIVGCRVFCFQGLQHFRPMLSAHVSRIFT